MKDTEIVVWDESYGTGIEFIDNQHRELVKLTNELYQACLAGNEAVGITFKDAMSRMVEYVRFHFTAELEILKRIDYPDYCDHKKQHDTLVMHILAASREYSEGRKFAPNQFVRTLKNWIFGHIAVRDRLYRNYIAEKINQGLLTSQQIYN